jgi:intracellular sulfur oxidation DsrE/DsrF family protein
MHLEHPFITKYGAATLKPNAAFQPDSSLNYKVLFDIRETANEAREINQGLGHIAKLLNLLLPTGIRIADCSIIAILHGPATIAALNDQTYRDKFGIDNPNNALIAELTKNGVQIHVCMQALQKQKLSQNAIHDKVGQALSSLTVLINCQLQNYAYVPFNYSGSQK